MLDFSKMKWRLRDHKQDQIFLTYPDLQALYNEVRMMVEDSGGYLSIEGVKGAQPSYAERVHPGLSPQDLMCFIIYVYHIGSPLIHEVSMHKRRAKALGLIGTTIETSADLEKNKQLVQYIVGANSFVNRVALHLCKFENNFKWIELCRKQDMLDDVFLTLKEEQTGTEKKSANEILKIKLDIEKQAEGLQQRIQQLAQDIFMNDMQLIDYSASHVILEQRKALITPERVVAASKAKQNG